MALTFTQQPNSLVFAKNPIIVKVKTDKELGESESLLRIICTATFDDAEYTTLPPFEVELSQPVENGGMATFNLSDAAQTLITRIHASIDMNLENDESNPDDNSCLFGRWIRLNASVWCKEVWVRDGYEVDGESTSANPITFGVIPGGFTDFEMISRKDIDIVSSLVGEGYDTALMTRKPDLGIVYRGEVVLLPVVAPSSDDTVGTEMYIDEKMADSSFAGVGAGVLKYSALTTDFYRVVEYDSDMRIHISGSAMRYGYYRHNAKGVYFLRFINGFGAIENISVRSKDSLSYEMGDGATHSLVQDASVRPYDRRYATKSQPVGVYQMSSGYVSKQWAEWYVQELLVSPRVWMQMGDVWVPCIIEAGDDCVIYDRTKPSMPHVDFTIRLAIDGVTGCAFTSYSKESDE